MYLNGVKWSKMAQNDVKMAKNTSKGSKMEQNGRFPGKNVS